jgi:hypothetical protein
MELFISKGKCPNCEYLLLNVAVNDVKGLKVWRLPTGSSAEDFADVAAMGAADYYEIRSVPSLVLDDGRVLTDVAKILGAINGNC